MGRVFGVGVVLLLGFGILSTPVSAQSGSGNRDRGFQLEQNFPNPFNPVTTIMFSLPEKGDIHLAIFDVSGRLVKTLHDGVMDAGKYKATWDGRSDAGRVVSSGVYFCKLVTADKVAETKMVLLK